VGSSDAEDGPESHGWAARRAKVPAEIHILRHTYCSHLAMRRGSAREIQELAGHQNLVTTQRYMHLTPAGLEATVRLLDQPKNVPAVGDILETGNERRSN
jgi:integrase